MDNAMDVDAVSSDDSDYELDDALSSSSGEDDMKDEDLFEPEEPFDAPVPPPPPRHAEISAEELAAIIQDHQQNRTVSKLLTKIDTNGNMYLPLYSEPQEVGQRLELRRKTFGTVLHFACRDPNGDRGTEKIRIILDAARRAQVNIPSMLSLGDVQMKHIQNDVWIRGDGVRKTPLQRLLENDNATIEAVRLICRTWPNVVNIRFNSQHIQPTTLMEVLKRDRCDSEDTINKLASITKVLLETADQTPTGARGLVSAPQTVNPASYVSLDEYNGTAVHLLCTYHERPDRFLPLILRAWPDALKYCGDGDDYYISYPLHDVAKHRAYVKTMKSLAVILNESTLEAIAVALLRADHRGELGFHLVLKAVEDESTPNFNKALQEHMRRLLKGLVYRKDQLGRTLLHYVAANRGELSTWESQRLRSNSQIWQLRQELGEPARGLDLDPSPQESELIEKERDKLRERNAGYIQEVCRWILSFDASLAFVQDNDGLNPFHFAMSRGKQWGKVGLERLVEVVPDWAGSQDGTYGLYPFMLAASYENVELDTVYELLRFGGSLSPSN